MGKKKDKKGKHGHDHGAHEAGRHDAGHRAHGGQEPGGMHFTVPPQMAGMAALAMKQVATPAFQQLIAGALGQAGKAMEAMAERSVAGMQRGAAERSAAPVPPTTPMPPVEPVPPTAPVPPVPPEPQAAYRPHFEFSGATLTPEAAGAIERVAAQAAQAIEGAAASAAHAIETAATAFERWVDKQARTGTGPRQGE